MEVDMSIGTVVGTSLLVGGLVYGFIELMRPWPSAGRLGIAGTIGMLGIAILIFI